MKKRKQANIKEMLKQKKNEASEENFDRIKISPYLLNSNDLTKEKHYEVSMFAMTYFCEHSNINEILDRYLEKEKKTNFNQDDLLSALIINVTSYIRQRRNYPLNMFMFESSYHESIGRFLLKHYEIKTKEDLQDANLFLVQNNLNHCHVMMNLNNQFRSDEQEYINRKKQKIGYQNLKQFLRVGSDHALRLYNQKHNLFIKYHINEITLEEMCEISTIERITRRDMNAEKIPNNQYDNCLVRLFNIFKTNPALIITHDAFYIFPQYLLIINNLTHEQERIVTERMDYFYEYTNAEDLLLLYRKNLKILKREERRKNFFLEYIRLADKKGPPFNYLMWVKEDDESPKTYLENNKSICEAGPSGSNVWKKKTVAEKNDTIQSVPEPVTVQVERISNKENVIIENQLARNPREYISAQIPGSKYAEIIKLLREEDEIVAELKKEIIKNPLCSKMWDRNYKHILWNCIHFNLEERNEYFISILIKCHCRNRQKLNEMLKEIDIDVNVIQSFGEPIASSTQTMNILIENERSSTNKNHQKRPFQNDDNSDDILSIQHNVVQPIKKIIKQEVLSQTSLNSSDVEIVPLNIKEVVSISDDEDNVLDVNNIVPNNNGIDVFQQNLNVDSQVNQDINASLEAEYGLITHRNAVKNVKTRKRPNRVNKSSKMVYESDTTVSNGKITNANCNIQQDSNNFSIFFSTQLMFDYAYHSTTQILITFAKSPKSSISSLYPNDLRPCFLFETQRVMYIKNIKFEMLIDLPQFSIYDVHIKNASIKETLNMNNHEWDILLSNLDLLEYYEFVRKTYDNNRSRKEDAFENVIKKHLDLFFSSLINFKTFNFKPHLNSIESIKYNKINNSKNVTRSIKHSVLQKIKKRRML